MIGSVKDPRLVTVRELESAAGRRAAGRCVLEGEALIAQALEAGAELDFLLTAAGHATGLVAGALPVHEASATVLRQALRTQKPVHALAVARLPEENAAGYGEMAVVLDGVADPGNVGTIVRTACGLGVPDIVFTDPGTDYTSRRVLESSRAAVLRCAPHRFADPQAAVHALRDSGFEVVACSPRGRVLQSLAPLSGGPVAVVVGNETAGSADSVLELADHVVRIPMAGEVESLNVGVATGLSLHELRSAMVAASLPQRCRAAVGELTPAVRAALAERLSTLDHLSADEFEALVRGVADPGMAPDRAPPDAAARAQLVALWPEFQHALRQAHPSR